MSLFKGNLDKVNGDTKAVYYSPAQWHFTFKTKSNRVLILH